jgi:hypothetical protein
VVATKDVKKIIVALVAAAASGFTFRCSRRGPFIDKTNLRNLSIAHSILQTDFAKLNEI